MEIDRTRRVGELIQRELAQIIAALSDPRIGLVTVTDVRLSRDLKQAKIYVTEISGASKHQELIAVLQRAAGHLKRELSHRLALRSIPNLQFSYDVTTENSLKMRGLIQKARLKDEQ